MNSLLLPNPIKQIICYYLHRDVIKELNYTIDSIKDTFAVNYDHSTVLRCTFPVHVFRFCKSKSCKHPQFTNYYLSFISEPTTPKEFFVWTCEKCKRQHLEKLTVRDFSKMYFNSLAQ